MTGIMPVIYFTYKKTNSQKTECVAKGHPAAVNRFQHNAPESGTHN